MTGEPTFEDSEMEVCTRFIGARHPVRSGNKTLFLQDYSANLYCIE